jgi:molecular chaperone GrpE
MVAILREADRGSVAEAARQHKISEQTIYIWRKKFGVLDASDVKKLRSLEAENARLKRMLAEREMAIGVALAELLPIIDDIDRARQHGELEGAFRTVGESLEGSATKLGLERFGAEGDEFDPMQHEAIATESRDGVTTPTVVAVYQAGYRYAGRVLRPARVAVAGTD